MTTSNVPTLASAAAAKMSSREAAPRLTAVRRQPHRGWVALDVRELWRYRELLVFHAIRDLKVRYKQTLLGVGWALLQPALTMIVFSTFFGRLAGIRSGGVPYPIFAFCALLPWQLFAYALTQSSNSLVNHAETLKKVYFPRLILPLASVLSGLVDFAIGGLLLVALLLYYGIAPGRAVITLPFFVLLAVAAALAVGLWLSALNAKYRDVRYTIPFLAQVWLFVTPVAYPSALVPERWQPLYALNPMAGVVDGFRWALLGAAPPGPMLLVSVGATTLLLTCGLYYFRRVEHSLADIA
jgi:lipopolysaccharide transport system permease protein